jgi:hypothetical protein
MRVRWVTKRSSLEAFTRFATSAVPKLPLPAAHHTLMPLVSRTEYP